MELLNIIRFFIFTILCFVLGIHHKNNVEISKGYFAEEVKYNTYNEVNFDLFNFKRIEDHEQD